MTTSQTGDPVPTLRKEIEHLRVRVAEAESSLRAFASGEVDTVLQGGAPLLLAKAQESLRESEQRYRALFSGMLNGYFYGEMFYEGGQPSDFVFLEINPAFAELSGLKDVVGRRASEVLPGLRQSNPDLFEVYGRVAQTGRPEALESYVPALERWFQISAYSPRKNHFIALFDNVTERKSAAENLARKELYFRSLIEHGLDIVAVVRRDGKLEYVSPAVDRVLGYAPEAAVSLSWLDRLHPDDRAAAESLLREAFEGTSSGTQIELRLQHRDGTWRTLSLIGQILPRETGMSGLILNARDLTEHQRLEAELRASQKMEGIGRLAGGIAHDFNNVLSVILGYADVMEPDLAGQDNLRSSLLEIRSAGQRAATLTRQLLAFSRKQTLEPRVLLLNTLILDLEKMLRRLISEDIILVNRLEPKLWNVKADPGQLDQILINLSVNARDAMPTGGTLTLETANVVLDAAFSAENPGARTGDYVELKVSDTGAGMTPEVRARAFEPFFTTKEHHKGTGLGLSTVYGIVKQSDGYVSIASEPGHGASIRIFLPRVHETLDPSGPEVSRPSAARGNETILLVEDEAALRRLARTILASQGYKVLEAASGDEALRVSQAFEGTIDLLVTDVVMPGMDGRELWEKLSALKIVPRVLFSSGYTAERIDAHGVLSSEFTLLPKPYTQRSLSEMVRSVLDAPVSAT